MWNYIKTCRFAEKLRQLKILQNRSVISQFFKTELRYKNYKIPLKEFPFLRNCIQIHKWLVLIDLVRFHDIKKTQDLKNMHKFENDNAHKFNGYSLETYFSILIVKERNCTNNRNSRNVYIFEGIFVLSKVKCTFQIGNYKF